MLSVHVYQNPVASKALNSMHFSKYEITAHLPGGGIYSWAFMVKALPP